MNSIDCYSSKDRHMMLWSQRLRAEILHPVLAALKRWHVTADAVTLTALVAGLAFCPLLFVWPPAALVALALHVVLDGLDGALARFRGTAGRRGSFTDTLCDQIVVAASATALALFGLLHPAAATLYVFIYTVVVIFAMVGNALGVPYRFVVRPRFFVYLAIPFELYLLPGTLTWVVALSLVPLTSAMARGAFTIRRAL